MRQIWSTLEFGIPSNSYPRGEILYHLQIEVYLMM